MSTTEAPILSDEEVLVRANRHVIERERAAMEDEARIEAEAEAARKAEVALELDAALTATATAFRKARDADWQLKKKLVKARTAYEETHAAYKAAQRAAIAAGLPPDKNPVLEYAVLAAQGSNYEIRSALHEIVAVLKRGV